MKIYVNGELRLESDNMPYISATKGDQNYISSAIGVSAAWGSTITISKLNIE